MKKDYSTALAAQGGGSPRLGEDAALPLPRPPTTRSRILWFIAALAAASLTARFGVWQLSRAHQKLAAAALIAERGAQPPMPASELARDPAAAARQWQRHVVLKGQWDSRHTVFLMNRTMDERAGFFVMTPLILATGDAVVVQRGWVARDDADPMKPPSLATSSGEVHVEGHVAPWPSHWIDLGHNAAGPVRQNLERVEFAAETGTALRPVTVIEDKSADNAADGLRRDWAAPDIGVVTNYGYAVQWFAMSVGFLGLYVWQQFLRRRTPRDGEDPQPRFDAAPHRTSPVDDTSPP